MIQVSRELKSREKILYFQISKVTNVTFLYFIEYICSWLINIVWQIFYDKLWSKIARYVIFYTPLWTPLLNIILVNGENVENNVER